MVEDGNMGRAKSWRGVHFRMCDEKEKWMTLECDGAWKFETSMKVGKRQGTGNHDNLEDL